MIIDDNHSLHRDYQAVLCPDQRDGDEQKLDELEKILLGDDESSSGKNRVRNFQLQSAYQGEEAYELVRKHKAKKIRYPLAFVDMRMPPGWDGLETIERIRELDDKITFVIVTAYSDYSEEEIAQRLGPKTPVEIIYKPFDPTGIYEMSFQLVSKWNHENTR
ncbi:hypothetical protein VDG1235_3989 [Verrucomicrobiia bacterium DG1235]|nr:hypothetical protein VDG1235_3989 [Verrucomicrobiae bacterium DG1235]